LFTQKVAVYKLGKIAYKDAWALQEKLLSILVSAKQNKVNPQIEHYLLLCEHFPVYTLGKSGSEKNLLVTDEFLKEHAIEYYKVNRGGDITFHGFGQIVGYPILDLEKIKPDISYYIRNLEKVIMDTLQEFSILSERSPKETGVWVEPQDISKARKICAIGVRCSRWVTMHGFALNVNTSLDFFNHIIPCGIENKKVTSMKNELHQELNIESVQNILLENFSKTFQLEIQLETKEALL